MWLLALAKKKTASIPFFALLFVGLLLPLGCSKEEPPDTTPPAVVVWKAASANYLEEWTEFVGTTMPLPNRIARLSSRVEGTVVSVLNGSSDKPVAEGQQVDKGTILVQLDTRVVKNSLAEAEATQESLVEEKKQAQFAVDLASREVARLQELMKGNISGSIQLVSPAQIENAHIALNDAQSKLKGSSSRLIAGAKRVDALREQLQFHTLTSPIPGRLGRMQVVLGQTLSVGTPVADVIDVDSEIDVLCFIPPSVIGRLQVGQQAHTGGVEKDPSTEAVGRVEYIADQAEPDTGNFAVKVRFTNKEKHLRANSVFRFSLLLQPGKEGPSLPEAAVQEDELPPTVVLVTNIETKKNSEGKDETKGVAHRMQAELGLRARHLHQIEIVSLTDPEKEPGKEKVRVEVKDNQLLVDGKEALFIVEGAQGVQSGDIVKLDVEDE